MLVKSLTERQHPLHQCLTRATSRAGDKETSSVIRCYIGMISTISNSYTISYYIVARFNLILTALYSSFISIKQLFHSLYQL